MLKGKVENSVIDINENLLIEYFDFRKRPLTYKRAKKRNCRVNYENNSKRKP